MICKNCHNDNIDGVKFCFHCGCELTFENSCEQDVVTNSEQNTVQLQSTNYVSGTINNDVNYDEAENIYKNKITKKISIFSSNKKIAIIARCVVFAILLIVGVSACSNNDQKSYSTKNYNDKENVITETTDEQSTNVAVVNSDTIVYEYAFNEGYCLVEFVNSKSYDNDSKETYDYDDDDNYEDDNNEVVNFACIDTEGSVVFSDIDGLADDEGNLFYIDCRYKESFTENSYFDYYSEWDGHEDNPGYEPGISSYQFADGYICVPCRNCKADEVGLYYACIINSKGKVIYSTPVGTYSPEKNFYNYNNSDTDGPDVAIQYNGHKTYLIAVYEEERVIYQAVSADIGLVKEADYDELNNVIYPLGFGYFRCYEEIATVTEYDSQSYVIDNKGEKLKDKEVVNGSRFVSDTLMEFLGYNYYNITSGEKINFEKTASKLVNKKDNEENYIVCNFSSTRNYAGFFIVKSQNDGNSYTESYAQIDSEGNVKILRTFKGLFDENDSYDSSGLHGDYEVLYKGDKIYSMNYRTGKAVQLFKDYYNEVVDMAVFNGVVIADIEGKDRKNYSQVYSMDGKEIIGLSEEDSSMSDQWYQRWGFDDDNGCSYHDQFITSDGKVIDSKGWDAYRYEDGVLLLVDQDSSEHNLYNIMTKDGELLF